MASAAAEPAPTYSIVPIKLIHESAANPRRTFDEKSLGELAENVKAVGVLQPVLVRPVKGKGFELVFGARRLRAAKLAGLDVIPANVRELSELEVLEIQVTENANRADVHPLEEADAYRRLHEEHGKPVEEIAARIGKSRAHVYGRLKLCALHTAGRAAFLAGGLNPTTALLVARIPDEKLQAQAVKEIAEGNQYADAPMTADEAARHIQQRYMLRLADARFDTADADLVPGAGACGVCPKRTGNQAELFSDVKHGDTCTDPICFEKKSLAGWRAMVKEAEAKGVAVLDDKQAKKLFPYPGNPSHLVANEYVLLSDRHQADKKQRTYKQLLGRQPAGMAIVRDPAGKVHELFPRAELKRALKDAGHEFKAERAVPSLNSAPKRQTPAEKALAELENGTERLFKDKLIGALVARLEAKEPTADQWRELIDVALYGMSGSLDTCAARRGVGEDVDTSKKPKLMGYTTDNTEAGLLALAKKMNAAQLRALFVELMALHVGGYDHFVAPEHERLCKAFGVDKAAIKAAAKKELEAEIKAAKKAVAAETAAKPEKKKPAKKK